MNYFKYQSQQSMSKIWSLFVDLGKMSPEMKDKIYGGSDYSHTLEIVRSALNGNISLTDEAVRSFNLGAYEFKCRENEKLGRLKDAKTVLNIVEFDNSEEDVRVGYGDISDRKLSMLDESFDKILDNDEFEYCIRQLLGIRSRYIVEHGVDLVSVLLNSLKGIPESVSTLKELVKDKVVKDLVTGLCNNGNGRLIPILEAAVTA